jgi:hypothetical protein
MSVLSFTPSGRAAASPQDCLNCIGCPASCGGENPSEDQATRASISMPSVAALTDAPASSSPVVPGSVSPSPVRGSPVTASGS